MKLSTFLVSSVVVTGVLAAPYPDNLNAANGFLRIPVRNRHQARHRVKRDDTSEEEHDLDNDVYQYTADLKLGTPGQDVEVLLDTGSSDLWVFSDQKGGDNTYNPKKSSTYKYISNDFQIQYVSGQAEGDWVKDTVQMGDIKIEKQQFAAVNTSDSSSEIGIFGIGPTGNEAHPSTGEYPNFPQSLVDQKIIKKNAYSLYLDDLEASAGSILFGGVDSSKYTGDLLTVPMTSDNSLNVAASVNGSSNFEVSLDCGTSLTYIPDQIAEKFAKHFGAEFDDQQGLYFIDDVPGGSLEFSFSGAKVSVPGKELAVKAEKYSVSNPPKPYVFTVLPSSQTQGMNLLGDSFLRSAYVVFDMKDNQVAIAQASYDSKNSNIKAIEDDIPGAKKAPGASKFGRGFGEGGGLGDLFDGNGNPFADLFGPGGKKSQQQQQH